MPFMDILKRYAPSVSWTLTEGESGWNNTTRYAEGNGEKRVLRIYETHKDVDKLRFEHEVLLALGQSGLPFAVPVPQYESDGLSYVRLQDGTARLASLFTFTEGRRPDSSVPAVASAIGEAVGQLSTRLCGIDPSVAPAYLPYYELDAGHPTWPAARIQAFCASPPPEFMGLQDELQALAHELEAFRVQLPQLKALPHQLIHGDINDSNLLVALEYPQQIAAVLDFEFCTLDVRAMEPAVVLAGMLAEDGVHAAAQAFLEGYANYVTLTAAEIEAIPVLMRLRKLEVFVHFLDRYGEGTDGPEVLMQQIPEAAKGVALLNQHSEALLAACYDVFKKEKSI